MSPPNSSTSHETTPEWLKTLQEANQRIVDRLQRVDTIWVVRHSAEMLKNVLSVKSLERPLSSPARQILHILGLAATAPPKHHGDLNLEEWTETWMDLEIVFQQYNFLFFPDPQDYPQDIPAKWWQAAGTTMPVFLDHFNTLPLFYPEQLIDRLHRWFDPFEDFLREEVGLSLEDAITAADRVKRELQSQLHSVMRSLESLQDAHQQRDLDAWNAAAVALNEHLDPLYIVEQKILTAEVGEDVASAFFRLLSIRRGDQPDYFYPTEENLVISRPLIWIEEGRFGCGDPNLLLPALLRNFEERLLGSDLRERFLQNRAAAVAAKAEEIIASFLPPEGHTWSELYETSTSHFEHDVLAKVGDRYLVVEVKSTPPKEPFRDPEKAYERLRQDFRSDTGIQKAYDQARRLKDLLSEGGALTLYSKRGEPTVVLPSGDRAVHCICVTADSFGALATDLSLLLEKKDDEPYPWAVSVADLETALEGLTALGKEFDDLWRYLDARSELHGRVFGSDELEFLGAFLRFGSFDQFGSQNLDHIGLSPDLSDIFDELYAKKHELGPGPSGIGEAKPKHVTPRPNYVIFGEYFERMKDSLGKVGRNEPCPCGSGQKFKKCHGKLLSRLPPYS